MGIFFRRSVSFGPLRFNLSKSGVGASVGVKGARVTLTPRGTTYVTLGTGGFYYRQNIGGNGARPENRRTVPVTSASATPALEEDQILTADVEELRESSSSELVDTLNRRARMFNPAFLVFLLAGMLCAYGFVQLVDSSTESNIPSLPDVTSLSAASRQANVTDEYAVLIARYGQPGTVTLTDLGPVPVRTASYPDARLAITLVPAGCVETYDYLQAHKDELTPKPLMRGHHRSRQSPSPSHTLACTPPENHATTIVAYQDTTSATSVDSAAANRQLSSMTSKSTTLPTLSLGSSTVPPQLPGKKSAPLPQILYDPSALHEEQKRISDVTAESTHTERYGWTLLVLGALLLIPALLIHRSNRAKRLTHIVYDVSGNLAIQQDQLERALQHLGQSQRLWRLDTQSTVTDWKRNAGASYNVKRSYVSFRRTLPPRIDSNVVPACLDLGQMRMFFLPDQILYWQRGVFAAIEYSDLALRASATNFIEEQRQTSDSQQVGDTWRYVRKDGGPDRRFNNNRQLPIMRYGVVYASSKAGLNLVLHTSVAESAASLASHFAIYQLDRERYLAALPSASPSDTDTPRNRSQPRVTTSERAAMQLLDLKQGFTAEELSVAFRAKAQLYHPDKVAGLGAELQALASDRMQAINDAHEVLRLLRKT